MRRQWAISLGVVIALALVIGWIARNTYWEDITVPTMLRGEAARNPFYAAQRLVQELGASAEWRRAMGDLPSPDSVMMLTDWNWDLIEARRIELQRWVESGGRLLLDSTMAHGADAFEQWSGLGTDYPFATEEGEEETSEDEEVEEPEYEPRMPCRDLDLIDGESQVQASRTRYSACGLSTLGWLTSSHGAAWSLEDDEGLQAVRVNIGEGSVTLINGTPFANRELLNADNAVLFIDATLLHRNDHMIFVSEDEYASLLELIWIYGSPAVLLAILLIGIALWRNTMRFGPLEAAPESARRSLAEQIRGTGQFALRVGGGRALHAAMIRALHEAAQLRIPNYSSLQHADRIAAIARIVDADAEQLAQTINFTGKRSTHEFSQAVSLLDTVRTQLIEKSARRHTRVPSG
jgi:hypothetical protein